MPGWALTAIVVSLLSVYSPTTLCPPAASAVAVVVLPAPGIPSRTISFASTVAEVIVSEQGLLAVIVSSGGRSGGECQTGGGGRGAGECPDDAACHAAHVAQERSDSSVEEQVRANYEADLAGQDGAIADPGHFVPA